MARRVGSASAPNTLSSKTDERSTIRLRVQSAPTLVNPFAALRSAIAYHLYLVRHGPDDYKLRSEGRTTVLQDAEVSDLVVGEFGHRSGGELAFEFFRRFVRSWIGRIHQLGIDQPRMRERERLDSRQNGMVQMKRRKMSGPALSGMIRN
jgi:hypothetical protein